MGRLPISMESGAAAATTRHEAASAAKNSTGKGATHMKGHRGFMPFPNSSNTAVERAAAVGNSSGRLRTKAMKIAPEGTPMKHTELLRTEAYTATEVQHDESVGERADLEGDLHRIVRAQFPGLHALLKEAHTGTERWRTAGLEVPRIEPRALASGEKHQTVEVWGLKREVHKDVSQLHEPGLYAALS